MTLIRGRFLFLALLAFLTGCLASDDLPPQPRYVSTYGNAPAATAFSTASAQGDTSAANPLQAEDNQYFIEFRSRYALTYGHTYVVFGRTNQAGEMINPEVAGLHPASNSEVPYVLGHFIPVPAETGWSDGDLEEEYRSASWRVLLNEAQYREVVAYIRKLQKRSITWNATVYNCNAFTADIARSMGYETPAIWLRPQQFITRLREMNADPNATVKMQSSRRGTSGEG